MGQGRRPLAQEIHQRNGSYRINPNRENKSAPKADGQQPEMPDYFNEDECLKWLELCQDLEASGILSSDCREIMIAYCTAYGGWMKARRAVEKVGIVIIDKKGDTTKLKRNPFSVELHKYRDEMNRLLPEFGLTPSSRQKLVSLETSTESPIADLMSRFEGVN